MTPMSSVWLCGCSLCAIILTISPTSYPYTAIAVNGDMPSELVKSADRRG
jgi:hypothetical protein